MILHHDAHTKLLLLTQVVPTIISKALMMPWTNACPYLRVSIGYTTHHQNSVGLAHLLPHHQYPLLVVHHTALWEGLIVPPHVINMDMTFQTQECRVGQD